MIRTKRWIIVSLILNSILLILELIGLSEAFIQYLPDGDTKIKWYQALTYYTELSNIALAIGSIFSIIMDVYEWKGKKIPSFFSIFKYVGSIVTMVTFTTILFFVFFLKDISYAISMHGNMWLFLHTICPLLGFISYVFFEYPRKERFIDILYPTIFTTLYTIMILVVYLTGGRLPYVSDYENDILITFGFILVLGIIETSLSFILALGTYYIKKIILKKQFKEKTASE